MYTCASSLIKNSSSKSTFTTTPRHNSCQRYVCGGLWHRAFETHSHHLGSQSITHPNPEGRVTAGGDQQLMANTSTRVCRDCVIPMGADPPCEVMSIPPELAEEQGPIQIAGSTMFSTRLIQDAISGSTYINMMTYSLSLVGLGVTPLVGDHSMLTLLGEEDIDSD